MYSTVRCLCMHFLIHYMHSNLEDQALQLIADGSAISCPVLCFLLPRM